MKIRKCKLEKQGDERQGEHVFFHLAYHYPPMYWPWWTTHDL